MRAHTLWSADRNRGQGRAQEAVALPLRLGAALFTAIERGLAVGGAGRPAPQAGIEVATVRTSTGFGLSPGVGYLFGGRGRGPAQPTVRGPKSVILGFVISGQTSNCGLCFHLARHSDLETLKQVGKNFSGIGLTTPEGQVLNLCNPEGSILPFEIHSIDPPPPQKSCPYTNYPCQEQTSKARGACTRNEFRWISPLRQLLAQEAITNL